MEQITKKKIWEGRLMTVWLDVEGWDQIEMTAVYPPADGVERRRFFSDIEKHIPPHRNQIVAGYFNCAPRPHLDKRSGNASDGGRHALKDNAARNALVDIWRKRNSGLKQFTWRNKNRTVTSRIDYWMVSNSLGDATEQCYIMTCTLSDHQPVALTFPIEYSAKGPSYWKCNVDVLKEEPVKVMVSNALKEGQNAKTGMEIQQWCDVGKAK